MPFLDTYLTLLDTHHAITRRALAGLNQEALDWSTDSNKNSLAVLASHIAGSERYWLGSVVADDWEERERGAEFRTIGLSEEELCGKIDWIEAYTQRTLRAIESLDLDAVRPTAKDETSRDVKVGWVLLHVLEHTAYHAGQMNMLRKAWLDSQSS